jgi:hypothetical protein
VHGFFSSIIFFKENKQYFKNGSRRSTGSVGPFQGRSVLHQRHKKEIIPSIQGSVFDSRSQERFRADVFSAQNGQ